SLRYFDVAVSDPSPGLPQFMAVGYMDGIPISRYDSEIRRAVPMAKWMETNLDQHYWDEETQITQRNEQVARMNLEIA
ncbi:HA1F protein, partial [Galbula dea]|nr:HA1F protein [Galbula dea]